MQQYELSPNLLLSGNIYLQIHIIKLSSSFVNSSFTLMTKRQSYIMWEEETEIPKNIADKFQQSRFNLDNKNLWISCIEIFSSIKEWRIIEFQINYISDTPLTQSISHITFPQLQEINLRHNNIISIEGFNRLFMPALKVLWIDSNRIWNVSDLRKTQYSNLSDLCLFKNKIVEGRRLTELAAGKVNMIRVQYKNEEEQMWNSDWLFKIQTNNLKTLSIKEWQLGMESERRIKKNFFRSVLKKKYPMVNEQ